MTNDVHELHLRICRLEAELSRTTGHVETLRRRWRRTLRGGVVVVTVTLASVTSFTLSAQEPTTYKDMTVTAPFRVVDKSGKIIMIVGDVPLRGVSLRDEQGTGRISLTPMSTPGISLSGNGNVDLSLAAGIQSGLYIRRGNTPGGASEKQIPSHVEAALEVNEIEGGKLSIANKAGKNVFYVADGVSPGDSRIAIGTSKGGAFGIRVYNSAGDKLLTSMGETNAGQGALAAYDSAGLERAVMFGDGEISAMSTAGQPIALLTSKDNRGRVAVNNASKVTVANLTSESAGGGLLELASPAGNRQATVGVTGGGEGKACVINNKRGEICLGQQALPGTLPGAAK